MYEFDLARLWKGLDERRLMEFISVLARMEYAMTQCHYTRSTDIGNRAIASCKNLSWHLDDMDRTLFLHAVKQANIGSYLISHPPCRYIITEEGIDVSKPIPIMTTQTLLQSVWLVRDQIFYGNTLLQKDRERDHQLMSDAVAILMFVLERDQRLKDCFMSV